MSGMNKTTTRDIKIKTLKIMTKRNIKSRQRKDLIPYIEPRITETTQELCKAAHSGERFFKFLIPKISLKNSNTYGDGKMFNSFL